MNNIAVGRLIENVKEDILAILEECPEYTTLEMSFQVDCGFGLIARALVDGYV